jgi:RNA-binding protein
MLKLRRTHPYSTKTKEETVITPKMKRRIKSTLSAESPTVHIGKEGATTQIINEVSKQLDTREMIKAKILRSALKEEEAKNIAAKIAEQTESQLIDVRGHTFLLYKRKTRKRVKTL